MKIETFNVIVSDDMTAILNIILMNKVAYIYVNSGKSYSMSNFSVSVSHQSDFISKSLLGNNLDQERMGERICRKLNSSKGMCQIYISYNLPDTTIKGIAIDKSLIEEKAVEVIQSWLD